MVFGDPRKERLALNEDTLWSGGPDELEQPRREELAPEGARGRLRRPLRRGGRAREEDAGAVQPVLPAPRRPARRLRRRRERSRSTAASSTSIGRSPPRRSAPAALTHTREAFASFPDQVIVLRVSADRPGRVSFTARLASRLRHATAAEGTDAIALRGRAPSHVDPSYLGDTKDAVRYDEGPDAEGMRFTAIVRAVVRGGTARTTPEGRLEVRGADEAVLLVSAGDELQRLRQVARAARAGIPTRRAPAARRGGASKPFAALRDAHVADHARLFGRVRLDLGAPAADRPTDERLRAYRHGEDPGARGPRLPVRPLPARRELPPRRPAREPAGPLERGRAPAVELELDDQHQQRDELLAGGGDEPLRVPRADAADDRRARAQRPRNRASQLRRPGLGGAPQRRSLAADGPRR